MSNRTIFLLVVASAVSIFALWLVWRDGSRYIKMTTRDDMAADTTQAARSIGRAEFVWKEMDIPIWTAPDSLAGKIVVPNSMPDSGDVPYLAKINDSTFAWLWLPGTRVRRNIDAWMNR